MLNKPTSEADLLNKWSCLARGLGVAKFRIVKDIILVTLVVLLKYNLYVQQTQL
jgi:hypothetical protein